MSRRRKTPHAPPVDPKKKNVDEWVDSMRHRLARTLQSQQEQSRATMRTVLLRGGWSAKGADNVMERIPPDPNAPATEEETLVLVYPWMARLSDAQLARCIADLSETVGEETPDSAELAAMGRVFAYWRRVAEG